MCSLLKSEDLRAPRFLSSCFSNTPLFRFMLMYIYSWMTSIYLFSPKPLRIGPKKYLASVYKSVYQGSHRSGKSQEKVKILKSQEKVNKFWYRSGNFEIHIKVRKMWRKMEMISIWIPHSQILTVEWCHDLFAQSHICQLEMQENWELYFYSIWTFCKSSHNLVGMAHRNDNCYIFCQMITTIILLYMCDACEFLWRSGYHILGLQKVSKN